MAGTVRVEGLSELSAKLRALGETVAARNLKGAARDAMQPVEQVAHATAPVGDRVHKTYKGRTVTPGFLQRSIRRTAFAKRGSKNEVRGVVGVSREAFYGLAFVERGTSKMPARPWLVPAFEAAQGQVLDKFKRSLVKRIERAARKK